MFPEGGGRVTSGQSVGGEEEGQSGQLLSAHGSQVTGVVTVEGDSISVCWKERFDMIQDTKTFPKCYANRN